MNYCSACERFHDVESETCPNCDEELQNLGEINDI